MSNILVVGHQTPDPITMALQIARLAAGRNRTNPHPKVGTTRVKFFGPGPGTAKNYNERASKNSWNHYSDRADENGWNAVGHEPSK